MATAPVPYQSALIESLRAASPGFTSNNPGVTMLANPANSRSIIDFMRAPRGNLLFTPPPPPPAPAPSPAPAPAPTYGGGGGGGGPVTPGPVVIGPGPSFPVDPAPAPAPEVPDYTDDLWPPVEEPPPVETFPVPDPAPPEVVDLPPLPPEDEVATPFPVPDPAPPDVVDLPPLPPEDGPEVPDYTDDLWPPVEPEPQDPPQGEIVIEPIGGGDRDQIREADPVTVVSDPIDEWEPITLPEIDLADLMGPPLVQDPPSPSVEVVQDLPVTTTPAPVYDPVENFEIDRELGLVPEWDVYVPPFENSFDFASETK